MIKKLFLLLFLVIGFSFFISYAYAQAEVSPVSRPTAVMQEVVQGDYQLPYPGILPDNPLYTLKVLRDRIIEFLISDPLKKSEFYLLESDKRLNAGIFLLKTKPGKEQLAYSTISKGENYFEKSIQKIEEAKSMGKDITSLARSMSISVKKHRAVLWGFIEKGPKQLRENFIASDKRVEDLEEQVNSLLPN